jgi:beta-galactosidase/beta-glucuronidase
LFGWNEQRKMDYDSGAFVLGATRFWLVYYGHDKLETRLNETGTYRYRFTVPDNWKNKQVQIVFDGVMTDALVKINGKLAGPVHQGVFINLNTILRNCFAGGERTSWRFL